MSSDKKELEVKKLRKERNELAKKYYGKPFKDLCSFKKGAIDSLIAAEKREVLS